MTDPLWARGSNCRANVLASTLVDGKCVICRGLHPGHFKNPPVPSVCKTTVGNCGCKGNCPPKDPEEQVAEALDDLDKDIEALLEEGES